MISVILCAAGNGTRAHRPVNKVLAEYNHLPVLSYSLSVFSAVADEILVACRKEDEEEILRLISPYPQAKTVLGGDTRSLSVYYALVQAKGDCVLIHDAARPFVSEKIISACIRSVKQYGSGVCAVPATDTVAVAEGGNVISVPDRKQVFLIQTPQGFLREKLLSAFEEAIGSDREFTDESGLYAAYCEPPRLCEGDRRNRKLTYSEDFYPAERVGFGVDTHAFGKEQNFIVLAGVKVPHSQGLIAHSDGDVLVHAVMDALLSAAGLRDIGTYFPDTDEKFCNADSMELLGIVMNLIADRGLRPKNVSISVLAEAPRLAGYIENMKTNLAKALSLPSEAVGIAAGTNEKLGYVGEGKGITVYCSALLTAI